MACFDARANIEHLKQKQDAGASFFVTQLFFDNACFYRFRESAERAGVTAPITCGVMPLMSKAQVQRMVFMCGASLPAALVKLVAKIRGRARRPASGGHRVCQRAAGRP